ncbi:MAG: hypothetical protein ACJ71F_17895 [Nitrososphaeraceae archaeon]
MKWNIPLKTAVGNGTFELSHRMATSSIRDEVQEQAAKDAAHREIAMCLLSSHMLLNWLKTGIQLIKNEESLEFFRSYFYGKNNTIF